jgi:anion-transporting  ArsA/GET3 family ATPase
MLKQKIQFITGKGGVGKSTVALAIASNLAKQGKKVLLAELGQHSFFQDHLKTTVKYKPKCFEANLDICLWSGKECLKEYALHLLKIEALYNLFFENKISKSFIDIAPSLPELAILGKITSGIREIGPPLPYDVIIVDAYATGHMISMLRAPRGMMEAIRVGPMGEQSKNMLDILKNPEHCSYQIVCLPEELPITESLELRHTIVEEVNIKPQFIYNKELSEEEVNGLTAASAVEDQFLQNLKHRIYKEKLLKERLKTVEPKIRNIPFIYETDPILLLNQMKGALS